METFPKSHFNGVLALSDSAQPCKFTAAESGLYNSTQSEESPFSSFAVRRLEAIISLMRKSASAVVTSDAMQTSAAHNCRNDWGRLMRNMETP